MARYFLVPEARKDLTEIPQYIADDSVDAVLRVHDRFIEIFELPAENPDAGHPRDDLTTRPVRFFPAYSYLVVYSATTRPVETPRRNRSSTWRCSGR